MALRADVLIDHPQLEGMGYSVDMKRYILLRNGLPVDVKSRHYTLTDKYGAQISVKILPYPMKDFTPKIIIGKDEQNLLPAFSRMQYCWIILPLIALVLFKIFLAPLTSIAFVPPVIVLALYINVKTFRSNMGAIGKYGLSGVTTLLSIPAFMIFVVIVKLATGNISMQQVKEHLEQKRSQIIVEELVRKTNTPGFWPADPTGNFVYEDTIANGNQLIIPLKTQRDSTPFKNQKLMGKLDDRFYESGCPILADTALKNLGITIIFRVSDKDSNTVYEISLDTEKCDKKYPQ